MSLIEKVTRLRHPGVLRDFTWPADLPAFARFNLIYGWNGSGKTTISRLFHCLEQRVVPESGQVTLRVDGRDVSEQDFPQATVQVRVFNRDFVNESVFPVSGGDVPPILVVGKENVDKQKEADRLAAKKADNEAALECARTSCQQAEKFLDKHCTDLAKIIKDTLRVPGDGKYNEYDKRAYQIHARQMVAEGDSASHRLMDADRDTLLIQHRASIKPKVQWISYRLPMLTQLRDEVASLLETTVASSAIEALSGDPVLSEWMRHGLKLHRNRRSGDCLFCEQPLPTGRLAALESHFSVEYERFLQRVNERIEQLKKRSNQANDVGLPDRAAFYEDLAAEYEFRQKTLRNALKKVSGFVDALVQSLEEKKSQPFTKVECELPIPEVEAEVVELLNEIIRRHNKACDDFQARTVDAGDRLALDLIAQNLDEYSRLFAAAETSANAVDPLEHNVRRLSAEIARLERDIVEHRQPADELNEDLQKYLGHDELRLRVKDTGYELLRDGAPANSLSEGERTALALLYFLKSLGDRRFDLRHGIVVLDDPVSSLDANALYMAFGFIRHRTQDAAQLFLMTHNFTFFRQARNWFYHLKGQSKKDVNKRPAHFYMLERVREADSRCTTIRSLDPLLEQYESEYHYLFACVYRVAHATSDAKMEQNYGLPNIARRLLEMFLAFRRPQFSGELWKKLKDVKFEEARKLRIARFVHTHSHGDTIGEPEHDPTLLCEARSVLTDLLDLIKSEDEQHFEAMVRLVTAPTEEAETG